MNAPANTQNLPHLFKSPLPNWKFIFPNGKVAVFVRGMYTTKDPKEIAHLNLEIELGHPAIFVDPNEVIVSIDRIDPMAALRGRMKLELLAEIAAEAERALDPTRDMGKVENDVLRPGSTSDMAAVTANGDATARLAAIRAKAAQVSTQQVTQVPGAPIKIPAAPSEE